MVAERRFFNVVAQPRGRAIGLIDLAYLIPRRADWIGWRAEHELVGGGQ
jgi:hypothetical protein